MFVRSLAVHLLGFGTLVAQLPVVSWQGETMRLAAASVVATPSGFDVTLQMANDNGNGALPTSFRRWWHCQIDSLPAGGSTLAIAVTNAGYSDVILPVWSLSTDGIMFSPYSRVPASATPTVVGGTQHRFTLVVPPGVVALRLAKYFPYTVARKDAWLATLLGEPRVRSIVSLGNSQLGRPIHKIQLTDSAVPDGGKQRIWIHSGIHPAETTSYFLVEGLVEWLCSGDPRAEVLLDRALIEIVPMANPDGVHLGNYRTNANSSNLENEWSAPYNSTQPEIVALRTAIEGMMGTVAAPGANPIRVLLNLHSSHNVAYPFHFLHTANPNWTPGCTNCGVLPIVHQIESQWIAAFAARSPFVALGATMSSTLGTRPFVESMCHDRWTAVPGWMSPSGSQAPVMAITFEGTYRLGPDAATWNTEADYRQCGAEMGLALFDYLGLALTASAIVYGAPCATVQLGALLVPQPGGAHVANLHVTSAPPAGLGILVFGVQQLQVQLPVPWPGCLLRNTAEATAGFSFDTGGAAAIALPLPPVAGLAAHLQVIALDLSQLPQLHLDTSNGLLLQNDY